MALLGEIRYYCFMKVLYLLNRVQGERIDGIKQGKDNDNHLYGMFRLPRYGIETGYLELEQFLPLQITDFIRKHILNIYWVHLPLFFKFFSYDVIFTSTAFGSQLIHALYPFKKPKWVMLDFSLTGLLGEGKTFKQKLFKFIVTRASGIVTIDENEKLELGRRFPKLRDRIEFIRFAVDTEVFKPHHDIVEENIIFSPGRDPGRDFKTLFEATKGLDMQVKITTRSNNIKKLLPLPPWVLHTDLSSDELVVEFAKARIVVIPLDTRSDVNNAMGCSTLVEAMAMGKAIIATRTKTMESYITDGVNGILVPPQDPKALRAAIDKLLKDGEKREQLGREARAFVEKHCTAEVFASSLASYFKSNIV